VTRVELIRQPLARSWQRLPYRFERLRDRRVLVSNFVGEHLLLSETEFGDLTALNFVKDSLLVRRLRAKHIVQLEGETLPLELLAMKARTRLHRLSEFTALHMFVVTLRCEHSCQYCQVSRQNTGSSEFDMSKDHALKALDLVFRSPSPFIKIEFQGGEPLLSWSLVEFIVEEAERRNVSAQRKLGFVVTTNLALLNDRVIEFAREHNLSFSTSLDGPEELHNRNRPRPGGDSWQRAIAGIHRIQTELGPDKISALMTTSLRSLGQVEAIINTYVENGLVDVFLRPLSPYGFAARRGPSFAYDNAKWLEFYERGLDYLIDLAVRGSEVVERYAAVVLRKMLTNEDPGYVDLMSPAGIGIRAMLYNYDGFVYASDEGRMLAEMNDITFQLGHLDSHTYEEIVLSDALLDPLEASFSGSVPMCSDCAFESWCGSDPVYHHATSGDVVGRKPESGFCNRNMEIFKILLDRYHGDPAVRDVFRRWARS
jgi:uncharacterized protein